MQTSIIELINCQMYLKTYSFGKSYRTGINGRKCLEIGADYTER